MSLCRQGEKRFLSKWHSSKEDALQFIFTRMKADALQLTSGLVPIDKRPWIAPSCGVPIVHQIHSLFRDGEETSAISKLSSTAWQEYARREGCRYILWGPAELDTLVQTYVPQNIVEFYKGVKFMAQRVDIARFIVLHAYGGIYADLNVFPKRDRYPQVPLGLCARPSRAKCHSTEWTIDVVVAARGNSILKWIVENMIKVTEATNGKRKYDHSRYKYIWNTTGSPSVAKFLKSLGCAPSLFLLSMPRPIKDLQDHIVQDESGKWVLDDVLDGGFEDYDILSAFNVSHKGKYISGDQVPLLSPDAQLPPFPEEDYYPWPTEKTEEGTGCEPTGKPGYEEPNSPAAGDDTGTAAAPYLFVCLCGHV